MMKSMRTTKSGNIGRLGLTVFMGLIFVFLTRAAFSQEKENGKIISYDLLEKTQDQIENLNVQVYKIKEKYPKATIEKIYQDGHVSKVIVTGVTDETDKKRLEVYVMDLENLRGRILNLKNRVGVYYVTETEPEPKMGFEQFYDKLYSHVTYPEVAKDLGVEGSVYVKFIIDEQGKVSHVTANEDIQSTYDEAIDALESEAIAAIKETSGDWIPAKVGGVPVSHWVVLPVQYRIETPYTLPFF